MPPSAPPSLEASAHSRPAFTLIEVLVASIILVVLAGLIVPRLTRSPLRDARHDLDRVEALLTALAARDALSADRLALEYDAGARTVRAVVLRPEDPARPLRSRLLWLPDPLLTPVRLEATRIERAALPAGTHTRPPWRAVLSDPDAPPRISLLLALDEGPQERRWTVSLTPASRAARTVPGDLSLANVRSDPAAIVDLDAAGRSDEPW